VFGRSDEEASPQARLAGVRSGPDAPRNAAGGPPEGLILLVFTILTLAATAFVLIRAERNAEGDPAQKAARGEVVGLDRLSLVREPNLRRVLAKIDAGPRPLVADIRVAPARIDLTVRDDGGSRSTLSVDPAFKGEESDLSAGDGDAVRASKLDPGGPERMLRAVARRSGVGVDAVDYVTLAPLGLGELGWYMFLKEGAAPDRQWAAAMDGSDLRHPGEPPRRVRVANARRKRRLEAQQRRIRRASDKRNACLSRANDAQAAARCVDRYQP
jgi:hypothetical protein